MAGNISADPQISLAAALIIPAVDLSRSAGDRNVGLLGSNFLGAAGGTLTGALTLNADPASALQAATKQYVDDAYSPIFGTGVDGALTVSSGITTLARDMHYTNVTISGTATINMAGFRMFVSGTLDISAAPAAAINRSTFSGSAASGATGGANNGGVATGFTVGGTNVGTTGGTGNTTTGTTNPTNASTVTAAFGGDGGSGGTGGTGVSAGHAGGTGAVQNTITRFVYSVPTIAPTVTSVNSSGTNLISGGNGGGGGGQGGGDGANAGGGGGGGGNGGGCLAVFARTIARGSNVTAGIIRTIGGNGAAGAAGVAGTAGGGAGGGGGGGGLVFIVCEFLTGSSIANAIDVSGGNGGAGGNGSTTGAGGASGTPGLGGYAVVIVMGRNAPAITSTTLNASGGSANSASGSTGGATATVTQSRLAL